MSSKRSKGASVSCEQVIDEDAGMQAEMQPAIDRAEEGWSKQQELGGWEWDLGVRGLGVGFTD